MKTFSAYVRLLPRLILPLTNYGCLPVEGVIRADVFNDTREAARGDRWVEWYEEEVSLVRVLCYEVTVDERFVEKGRGFVGGGGVVGVCIAGEGEEGYEEDDGSGGGVLIKDYMYFGGRRVRLEKGLEFGALLENFGGNGPKSNGVKRRDSVWVLEMTMALAATSIDFKEDNSCCKKLLQGPTFAIATAKMRGECPKRPGEHGSEPALLYIVRVVIWILAYSLHMERLGETGHFFRKMVVDPNAPVQDKALQREFPPCLSPPPAPYFDEKDVDGLHGPVIDSRCHTRWWNCQCGLLVRPAPKNVITDISHLPLHTNPPLSSNLSDLCTPTPSSYELFVWVSLMLPLNGY
ncbi:hypothetical protein Tco_0051668 [Tanacetum coccineum]